MRVLAVHPFGLGDVLFSFWGLEALKRLGDVTLGFLCNERTREMVSWNPSVQHIHEFNRDELRAQRKRSLWGFVRKVSALISELRRERYDLMIDFSMGREFAFLGLCAGIPRRVGFDYRGRGFFLTHKLKVSGFDDKPMREFYLDLIRFAAPEIRPKEARYPLLSVQPFPSDASDPVIAVVPGGGASWGPNAHYKQWPAARYAECVRRLCETTGFEALIITDSGEESLAREIQKQVGDSRIKFLHAAPLREVASRIKSSRLFIGNDGGLLHLANAMQMPCLGIFGPVSEVVYGPHPGSGGNARVLTHSVPCRPCYRNFKFEGCAFNKQCLEELSVDSVWKSAHDMIKGTTG